MFEAWGRALTRRRRLALGVTVVFVAFAGVWGTGVFGKLSSGDTSPHRTARASVKPTWPTRSSAGTRPTSWCCTAAPHDRRRPRLPAGGHRRAERPAARRRDQGDHVLVHRVPSLVSADRHATYAVLQLTGADDAARHTTYDAIEAN